ncbi:MAG: vitamin B12 dependent-methionine synthase activation domain-containing protein, partial [Alphaproteobacteria bacterium]
REAHERRNEGTERLSLAAARANRLKIDWSAFEPVRPRETAPRVFADYDLAELRTRIDWKPFFQAWELSGAFPAILDDPVVGEAARSLHRDALDMLERMIAEKWTRPRAVVAFFPANAEGDDIVLFADEARAQRRAVVHSLRQQRKPSPGRANLALADFVAPIASGKPDWLGAFIVTAGPGIAAKALTFERANDDYSAILVKALGDRLAEAFAERMHERVRREFWSYAPAERFSNKDLIGEHYRGIRPAPGYPACPDHTEKHTLFKLLEAEGNAGVTLTESCAMTPASSVSGWYFAHPDSAYFGVGRIERDQVEDYARRKGMALEDVERWLAPNLNYTPVKRAANG